MGWVGEVAVMLMRAADAAAPAPARWLAAWEMCVALVPGLSLHSEIAAHSIEAAARRPGCVLDCCVPHLLCADHLRCRDVGVQNPGHPQRGKGQNHAECEAWRKIT